MKTVQDAFYVVSRRVGVEAEVSLTACKSLPFLMSLELWSRDDGILHVSFYLVSICFSLLG